MKKLVLLFTLMIATSGIYAQTKAGKSGSLLWKISGKDLSKPSYLLGTMHFKPGEYLDSIPGARAALEASEQVVGELLMSDMAGLQAQMAQVIQMTPDTTYKMLYSNEDYNFVSEKIASLMGAGLDQLGMMNPVAIQLTVVALTYMQHFPNINTQTPIDIYIQAEATKEQKTVLGLETVDEQIRVLFGMKNLQQQANDLLCYMKNLDKINAFIPEMVHDYRRGDLNKLYELAQDTETCPSSEEEMDALNKDRNEAWMKKLPAMMKAKSSFIAVGALHLAGEVGLLNLLEGLGYTVEPVR